MNCFILPDTMRKKITSATSNYWWGGAADSRAIHWRKWKELTLPKCHGGMGFRDIKHFNVAMLGKQGWRLMTAPDTLCARVLKGKYYPNGDFLSARLKRNSSHTWRAILTGRNVLNQGLIRCIGDGESTNIWHDRWIPGRVGGKPVYQRPSATAVRVSELLSVDGHSWDDAALRNNLLCMDVQAIKSIPLGRGREDCWAWAGERHGLYSVRSAYRMLVEREDQERAHAEGRAAHSAASNDPH